MLIQMRARDLAFAFCLVVISLVTVSLRAQSAAPLYLDPHQPIAVRVESLLSQMTLKEKVGQLNIPVSRQNSIGLCFHSLPASTSRAIQAALNS